MGFDSIKYVGAFHLGGGFPAIHDAIGAMLKAHVEAPAAFVDIGACTGLLSMRALSVGLARGICVEGNAKYRQQAVKDPRLEWFPHYVTSATLPALGRTLKERLVTVAIARRVFPEIELTERGLVARAAEVLRESGVRKLFVQGRVPTRNPASTLSTIHLEVEALSRSFRALKVVGQCAYLVAK